VNGHNKQGHNTLQRAIQTRINQELKYLYIKKQKLNKQLYQIHLICAENGKRIGNIYNLTLMKNFNPKVINSTQISTKN
jgi:hypothetical protein